MAFEDIPAYRPAERGQVVRSADWNDLQRDARNAIRTHHHTRAPNAPPDDSASTDEASQITAAEIASRAVTLAKLHPSVRELIDQGGGSNVATGTAQVPPQEPVEIEHGLGKSAVAVVLGVPATNLPGLDGEFLVYGGISRERDIVAAVPVDPGESFFIISNAQEEVELRWWAIAGAAER